MSRICVGVILYNPQVNEISRINSYIDQVDKVFIYDNSPHSCKALLSEMLESSNYIYLFNGINDGISKAFNTIADDARRDYDYMLLLDQDSDMILSYFDVVKSVLNDTNRYNIYCSNIHFCDDIDSTMVHIERHSEKLSITDFSITSGTIINLDFFKKLEGLDEKIFIDGVDRDFCLRLKEIGEPIHKINDALIYQTLGTGKKNLFGIYEHSVIRNYYIYRNRLYIINKYSSFFHGGKKFKSLYLSIVKQVLSIVLLERDKIQKLRILKRAKSDYANGKMYEFNNLS